MKSKNDKRATLALWLFAALILLFVGGQVARGLMLGNRALIEVRDKIINAVSGER